MPATMPEGHLEGKTLDADEARDYAYLGVAADVPVGHGRAVMERLIEIREARGLSQAQLAEMVGANQATISKIERGVGNPTLHMITRIARALQVHPSELFGRDALEARVLRALSGLDDETQREAAIALIEALGRRR